MNTLAMHYPTALEQPAQGLGRIPVSQARRARPRHHHQVSILCEFRTMGPVEFAQIPFDPVAHHRIPDLAGNRQSQSTPLFFRPSHIADEARSHEFLTLRENAPVFRLVRET